MAAALASGTVITLAALAGALPARAAVLAGQDVPGSQIAADLRHSPLYVDPSLTSAFPAAARSEILAALSKAPARVFVIAVPLVSGSQWTSAQQLADVVQNALGSPGIYLTLDAGGDTVDAWTWPSDPQGIDAPPYHAADAADAANLDVAPDAPVWQNFLRAIQLIDSGRAQQADQAAQAALARSADAGASGSSPGGDAAGGAVLLAGAAAVPVTLTVIAVRRRRRRRAGTRTGGEAPAFTPPRSVVHAAEAAAGADLRDRAQRELLELGELLEQAGPAGADGAPAGGPDEGDEDLARALDAYDAAGQTLDRAAGVPDLAGVLVLTQIGRCAAAAAQARQAGQPAPPAPVLCFFNPLHGPAAETARWRARGEPAALQVRVCGACAAALAQRKFPDVLTSARGIPWYEDAGTVWAATGYGQFSTDGLLQQILASAPQPGGG